MDWNKFNSLTILIVDDDQLSRELIKMLFKEVKNITVHVASNGREAISMMENHTYDMFLVDLYMPEMSGEVFVAQLKKDDKLKLIPIVLITTDRLTSSELKEIGLKYYLTKPFDFQSFLKSIYGFFEEESLLNET